MKLTKNERTTLQAIRDKAAVSLKSELGQRAVELSGVHPSLFVISKREQMVQLTVDGIRHAEPPKRGRPASPNGPTPQPQRMAKSIAEREAAGGRRLNIMLSPKAAHHLDLVIQGQPIPVTITAAIEHALSLAAIRRKK